VTNVARTRSEELRSRPNERGFPRNDARTVESVARSASEANRHGPFDSITGTWISPTLEDEGQGVRGIRPHSFLVALASSIAFDFLGRGFADAAVYGDEAHSGSTTATWAPSSSSGSACRMSGRHPIAINACMRNEAAMDLQVQIDKAQLFRDLHARTDILLLPNAWDAGSARLFAQRGFSAVATTSGGMAWSLDYADGERAPLVEVQVAIEEHRRPTTLIFTRQHVPTLDRSTYAPAEMLRHGAYVLNPLECVPDVLLMASGSEVSLIVAAEPILRARGVRPRLVSMPSWRLFEEQTAEYRESVLPAGITVRLAVEAASPLGWERWTGLRGAVIGLDRFGASAPGEIVLKELGFTVDHVVERALALVQAARSPNNPAPIP
jgi:hypothetical protein